MAHSAGIRLAIAHAARYPNRLARLVLITPPTSYLVGVLSDVATVMSARMAEPTFVDAITAFTAGPDPSSVPTGPSSVAMNPQPSCTSCARRSHRPSLLPVPKMRSRVVLEQPYSLLTGSVKKAVPVRLVRRTGRDRRAST